ncbi:MAG: ABC transporter permease [Candidatus Omnitrophica bacterium]|nr:ABC transporter permease [Candidatus Omnitrophota bacterium]
MKWQFMVSLRYLFGRRKEGFVSVTTFISIMGIAVGVAALIVTMAIMNGFNNEIEEKILNINPHIIITSSGHIDDSERLVRALKNVDGVLEAAAFIDGQALISFDNKVMGVLLRGIDADPRKRLTRMGGYLTEGTLGLKGNGAIIGSELASSFKLKVNDRLSIISPLSGKELDFKVNGIFKSGRYDYDLNLVFVNIDMANTLFLKDGIVSGIGLRVRDAFKVDNIKREILSFVGIPFRVMTWKEMEKNLFSALKLEKIVMFIVVAMIVFVACFNIISTLIMTVMEKTKDIGIMKAIGVTRLGVMSVFLLEGLYIGLAGILLGSGFGIGLCLLQDKYKFFKLPPDVYYIYSVPIQVRVTDTLIIIGSAFILGLIATVYPSLQASRLNPVDALKYE